MIDDHELVTSFVQVARLARIDLSESSVRVETLPAPHRRPSSLPKSSQAVYSFFLGDACLKVGKAGPKTAARFISQHYGMSAPSTLAKSILAHRERVAPLCPGTDGHSLSGLTEDTVGPWIEQHTGRVNVFLPVDVGPHALSLLEAFLQCRFRPLFEGRAK